MTPLDRIDAALLTLVDRLPGRRPEVLTVLAGLILALIVLLALVLPPAVPLVVVNVLAVVLLVVGWTGLSGAELLPPAQAVIALVTLLASVAVAVTGDERVATSLLGVGVLAVLGVEVATARTPRDHSIPSVQPQVDAEEDLDTRALELLRRTRPAEAGDWFGKSTSWSIVGAVSVLFVAVASSGWVALGVVEDWSALVLLICPLLVVALALDSLVPSPRPRVYAVLALTTLCGGVLGAGLWLLGRSAALMPVILPGLAARIGGAPTTSVFAAGVGLLIALVVLITDSLLPRRSRAASPTAALAFAALIHGEIGLVAYVLVRMSGI